MAKSIEITLKDRTIQNLVKPGRYTFGRGHNGIYLIVKDLADGGLSKVWNQKVYIRGAGKDGKAQPRELGLGEYPGVSVADVNAEAEFNVELSKEGTDPHPPSTIPVNVPVPDFKTVALQLVDKNRKTSDGNPKPRWGAKTIKVMMSLLNNHCFPFIGDTQVDQVRKRELSFMVALHSKTPSATASLVPFMKDVFDRCVFDDYIGANPIDDAFMSQLPRNTRGTKHYPALLEGDLPEAMAEIDKRTNIDIAVRSFLQAVILNEVRPHSAEDAEWAEIQWKEIRDEKDWNDKGWHPVDWDNVDGSTKMILWKIPGEHMKKGKPFNVPVSSQFLEILKRMRAVRGQGKRDKNLIFAGIKGGRVSRSASAELLRSLGFESDVEGEPPTLHGCRTTFRTWARKRRVPRDVAEAAMAHNVGKQTEITYMRWDLLEPRSRLQQAYGDYATGNLTTGWIWIEPEVQAQIDAERLRADQAERRADEAERQLTLVRTELVEIKSEFRDMNKLLKALLEQKSAA